MTLREATQHTPRAVRIESEEGSSRIRLWIYAALDTPPRLARSRWFKTIGPDVLFEVIDPKLADLFDDWMPAESTH